MAELAERVAMLETRMDMDHEDRERRRQDLDKTLEDLRLAVEYQTKEMARYKGVIGGISLAISLLWAGVAFFKDGFVRWLQG